jgi:HSP20 family protein
LTLRLPFGRPPPVFQPSDPEIVEPAGIVPLTLGDRVHILLRKVCDRGANGQSESIAVLPGDSVEQESNMDYIKIRFVDSPEGVDSEFRRSVEEMVRAAQPRFTLSRQRWRPQIDIYETGEEIILLADIAGVPREEIQLEIGPRTVKLSGIREGGTRRENGRYRLAEIPCGRFERVIALPVAVEIETARALYRDGILEIRLAKRPPDRVYKIHIQGR